MVKYSGGKVDLAIKTAVKKFSLEGLKRSRKT